MYLVLFLTWLDCSINVTSQGFACMHNAYIIYISTHNCCNLGYVFLYQHVRATFSGFSHLFILTSNGLKEMIHDTVFRLLIIRC